MDKMTDKVLEVINGSEEPLETREIEGKIPEETRTKILNRLRELWGKRLIGGKMVGAGRGTWIWWKKDSFANNDSSSGGTQ